MKIISRILLCLACLALLSACGSTNTPHGGEYSFTDALGREVSISESDRVAACHASFADCWLLAGGELVGVTSDAAEDHGLDVGDAAVIGTAKTVNAEALAASGATVCLMSADLTAHLELENMLEGLGIGCVYLRSDTFEDYASIMSHFCSVTGRDELYYEHVTLVGERIAGMLEKIPVRDQRTVLLMRVYSSGIKAKGDDNPAGLILRELGLFNIADAHPSLLEDMSLEHIVTADPDFIFVLTMGSESAGLAYLDSTLESNPAFSGLAAVRSGNYHILPKELFHYKANERWDESYEYIAKILHPELFGGN